MKTGFQRDSIKLRSLPIMAHWCLLGLVIFLGAENALLAARPQVTLELELQALIYELDENTVPNPTAETEAWFRAECGGRLLAHSMTIPVNEIEAVVPPEDFRRRDKMSFEIGRTYTLKMKGKHVSSAGFLITGNGCYTLQIVSDTTTYVNAQNPSTRVVRGTNSGDSELLLSEAFVYGQAERVLEFRLLDTIGGVFFNALDCDCKTSAQGYTALSADGQSEAMARVTGSPNILGWAIVGESYGARIKPIGSGAYFPQAIVTSGLYNGLITVVAQGEDCLYEGTLQLSCGQEGICVTGDCDEFGGGRLDNRNGPMARFSLGGDYGPEGGVPGAGGEFGFRWEGAPPLGNGGAGGGAANQGWVGYQGAESPLAGDDWIISRLIGFDSGGSGGAQLGRPVAGPGIRQIKARDGFVEVNRVGDGKTVIMSFYPRSVVPVDTGLFCDFTNLVPLIRWYISTEIDGPLGPEIKIGYSRGLLGGITYYKYSWNKTTSSWALATPSELPGVPGIIVSWSADEGNGVSTLHREIRQTNGNTVSAESWSYTGTGNERRLVAHTLGAGADSRTTAWTHYPELANDPNSNEVSQIDFSDGDWVRFEYTEGGRISKRIEPIGNQAPTSDPTLTRTRDYDYTTVNGPGDDLAFRPDLARLEIVRVNNQEITRRYRRVYLDPADPNLDQDLVVEEQQSPDPGLVWNHAKNIRTITRYHWDENLDTIRTGTLLPTDPIPAINAHHNKVKSVIHPDGTGSIFAYASSGTDMLMSEWSGELSVDHTAVVNGTKVVVTRNEWGEIVSRSQSRIIGGAETAVYSEVHSNPDASDQFQTSTYENGAVETRVYGERGIDEETDRFGVTRSYQWSATGHLLSQTDEEHNIEDHYQRDPAGRLLAHTRAAASGDTQWLSLQSYNTASEWTIQTNALGGATTMIRAKNGDYWRETATLPDPDVTDSEPAAQRIRQFYRDGRLERVAGAASFPVRYEYGTALVSTLRREFIREIRLDAAEADTPEVSVSYFDGLGRRIRREYTTPTGGSAHESWSYDVGINRLREVKDGDGVSTLIAYNNVGSVKQVALDVNRNGLIDEGGTDRITEWGTGLVTYEGELTFRQQVFRYHQDNLSGKQLYRETHRSLDGRRRWTSQFDDSGNPVTIFESQTLPVNGVFTRTITYPDQTKEVIEFQYGRLSKRTRQDTTGTTLTEQTYQYDEHGRLDRITDLRNGTTHFDHNAADQVTTVTVPPSEAGAIPQVYTTIYDNNLRPKTEIGPDQRLVNTLYTPTGLPKHRSGARIYPVDYTYDAQGRLRTQTTWKDFGGSVGSAVTRWNYDGSTGWLLSKDYPNPTTGAAPTTAGAGGPSYSYTAGGRLQQRQWLRGTTATYSYYDSGDLKRIDYSDSTPDLDYQTYDRLGRLVSIEQEHAQSADNITTSIDYADSDFPTKWTYTGGALGGIALERQRDALLRPDLLTYSRNTTPQTTADYTYHSQHGRLSSVLSQTNTVTYGYLGNSDRVESVQFGTGATLQTTRSYDFLGRLTEVNSTVTGQTLPFTDDYQFNGANQRQRRTAGDKSYWTYDYDAYGQLTEAKRYWADGETVAGQQFGYDYDNIGNRLASDGRQSSIAAYGSNYRNELTSYTPSRVLDVVGVATPTESVTVNSQATYRKGAYYHHALDFGGSAIAYEAVSVDAGANTENGNHYLPAVPNPSGTSNQTYDGDGNLTQDGRWIYTWDAENRLVQMHTVGGVPAAAAMRLEFGYDYQGRRISKKVYDQASGGNLLTALVFVYEGSRLVAEVDGSTGATVRSYTWGLDSSETEDGVGGIGGLVMVSDHSGGTSVSYYAETDGQGNVHSLIHSGTGAVSAIYEYGPFGELIRATGPAAAMNPFRYSTQYRDEETGLIAYLYRFYSPERGSWLNRDPIGELGGLNLAGFVNNDPINRWDAFGLAGISFVEKHWCRTKGFFGNLKDQVAGTFSAIMNPIDTFKGIRDAIADLGGTLEAIVGGVLNGAKKYQRSKKGCLDGCIAFEMEGAVLAEIGSILAGAGLVTKVGKLAKLDDLAKLRMLEKIEDVAKSKIGELADDFGDAVDAPRKIPVRHGPLNRGPLADDIADTFRSGSYTARTIDEPTTLFRVIGDKGNPAGSFWTVTEPSGPVQSIIDLALDPKWGNTATTVIRADIPVGTQIFEGAAAAQRGLVGGGNQIYIPNVNPKWVSP